MAGPKLLAGFIEAPVIGLPKKKCDVGSVTSTLKLHINIFLSNIKTSFLIIVLLQFGNYTNKNYDEMTIEDVYLPGNDDVNQN